MTLHIFPVVLISSDLLHLSQWFLLISKKSFTETIEEGTLHGPIKRVRGVAITVSSLGKKSVMKYSSDEDEAEVG